MYHVCTLYILCFRGQMTSEPIRILGRPLSTVSDTDGIGDAVAGGRKLEFRPKVRKKDVELYVESCRTKFGCFETDSSNNDFEGNL